VSITGREVEEGSQWEAGRPAAACQKRRQQNAREESNGRRFVVPVRGAAEKVKKFNIREASSKR